jgi:hypothetical protein
MAHALYIALWFLKMCVPHVRVLCFTMDVSSSVITKWMLTILNVVALHFLSTGVWYLFRVDIQLAPQVSNVTSARVEFS